MIAVSQIWPSNLLAPLILLRRRKFLKHLKTLCPKTSQTPTKKNALVEALELFKQVVENVPAKEIISFMKDEAEKARQHEL